MSLFKSLISTSGSDVRDRQDRLGTESIVSLLWLVSLFGFLTLLLSAAGVPGMQPSPIPVMTTTLVFVALGFVYQSSARILSRGSTASVTLLILLLSYITVFANGYLTATFTPVLILLVIGLYRGQYRLLAPYAVLVVLALTLIVSPAPSSVEFELRILLFSAIMIHPLNIVYESEYFDTAAKARALKSICVQLAVLNLILVIERAVFSELIAASLGPLMTASVGALVWYLIHRGFNRLPWFQGTVIALTTTAYFFSVLQNGLLPLTALPLASLFFFCLLGSFNALMLSFCLILLSVLGIFARDAQVADLLPLSLRLLAVGFMLAVALHVLLRYREREQGLPLISVTALLKVLPLAGGATLGAGLLLFDGFQASEAFDLSQLRLHDVKELIGLLLMFACFLWGFAALWYRASVFQRTTEHAAELTRTLRSTLLDMDLALKAGETSVFDLDVESGEACLRAGYHPRLRPGERFNIAEYAQRITSVDDAKAMTRALTSEHSDIQFSVLYPGEERPRWSRIMTGEFYEVEGRRKIVYLRSDVTALRENQEAMRLAAERQRELFAVIGHELRTPVASLQMILRDETTPNDAKIRTLEEITDDLLSVLDDMRAVVTPERAKAAQRVVRNPVNVTKRAFSPLSAVLNTHGMQLHFAFCEDLDNSFRFNEQALRQMVSNLVKNAALHSGGSEVWVRLDCDREADLAVLTIEDNGKGIPDEDVGLVFSAFGRGRTSSDGTGLGLYISSGLASDLGGTLVYEERKGGGSCFRASFPLEAVAGDPQEADKAQMQARVERYLDGMRVLIAEDDAMLRLLTQKILQKENARVTACVDGAEALAAFSPDQFDLVLTDLMMPNMSGLELTQALRAKGVDIPIIAVTAAVIGEETDQLLKAGANAVISKPITLERLVAALEDLDKETGSE